jgi:uncharacterized membrane protein YdcZ (DUF606 family)
VTQAAHHPPTALPLAAAVVSGAFVALQQRINGDLGASLGEPLLAAVVSFGTGLLMMAALVIRRRQLLPAVWTVPWWSRLGGLGGATLVFVGATAAPRIGVAVLTVGLVAGSVIGALAVDRAGLAPGGHRPITAPRLAGAALCLVAIGISTAEGIRSASPWLLALVVLAGVLIWCPGCTSAPGQAGTTGTSTSAARSAPRSWPWPHSSSAASASCALASRSPPASCSARSSSTSTAAWPARPWSP